MPVSCNHIWPFCIPGKKGCLFSTGGLPGFLVWFVLFFGLIGASPVIGQQHRILALSDPAYHLIERLQQRGYLLELPATELPYTSGAILQAIAGIDSTGVDPQVSTWTRMLYRHLGELRTADQPLFDITGTAGIESASHRRMAPLRPLEDAALYSNAEIQIQMEHNRFMAHLGLRHDNYYDRDPDGLDAVNRIQTRSNFSYLAFNSPFFSAHLGRIPTHWGPFQTTAPLLSDNPLTFDQLQLRFGTEKLSFSSVLGELDSITSDGRFTGTAGADSVRGNERRYVAAHRLDWRPTPHFSLTLLESILFSGVGTGPSLKFLNPLHPYIIAVDSPPKNDENNGLVGLMLWGQSYPFTLYTQLMIDDFDFINASEPTGFAWASSVRIANLLPSTDAGLALDIVSIRAYNAPQPEGRYVYLGRGLAAPFNDYVQLSAFADLYLDALWNGLTLSPRVQYLAQGEGLINQPYPGNEVKTILNGTIERTVRFGLEVVLAGSPHYWLEADLGVNRIRNRFGVTDSNTTLFVGQVRAGLRISTLF